MLWSCSGSVGATKTGVVRSDLASQRVIWLLSAEWAGAVKRGHGGVRGCHEVQVRDHGAGARVGFFPLALLTFGPNLLGCGAVLCTTDV